MNLGDLGSAKAALGGAAEKLGAMGDPVDYVYQGRLVRFCCAGCIGTFQSDPLAYLKKILAPSPTPAAAPAAR